VLTMTNKTLTNQEIKDLAENALHQACSHMQDALGVKTGDWASMFFSGECADVIHAIFSDYIKSELRGEE
jgi:hypothetical protein